jgi:hypothetical protein
MLERQTSIASRPFGLSDDDFDYFEARGRWLLKMLLFGFGGLPVAGIGLGVLTGGGEPLLWVSIQAVVCVAFGLLFYRGSYLGRVICIGMSTLSAYGALQAATQMSASENAFLVPLAIFYLTFAAMATFSKSIRVFFHAQRERSMNEER